jgi:hypothetical protein
MAGRLTFHTVELPCLHFEFLPLSIQALEGCIQGEFSRAHEQFGHGPQHTDNQMKSFAVFDGMCFSAPHVLFVWGEFAVFGRQ